MMDRLTGRSLRLFAAAALLPLATMPASAAPDPEAAITALARLSAAELDTSAGKGKAFLATLFPDPAQGCHPPTGNPNFDKVCFWSADPDAAWPDLLIGMMGSRIVSIAAPSVDRLDKTVWTCRLAIEDGESDGVKLCYPRTIAKKQQDSWSASWIAFINSAN